MHLYKDSGGQMLKIHFRMTEKSVNDILGNFLLVNYTGVKKTQAKVIKAGSRKYEGS